jgi:hypothetical protein
MHFTLALNESLEKALQTPEFSVFAIINIPEISPEMIIVLKTGKLIRATFMAFQIGFQVHLVPKVWSYYDVLLNEGWVEDAPESPTTFKDRYASLLQHSKWENTVVGLFQTWQNKYREQNTLLTLDADSFSIPSSDPPGPPFS